MIQPIRRRYAITYKDTAPEPSGDNDNINPDGSNNNNGGNASNNGNASNGAGSSAGQGKTASKQISSISAQTGASGNNTNTIVAAKTGDDEYIWLMFAVIVIIMTVAGTVVFIKMIRHNKL